jgi:hypothetical protein
MISEGLLKTLKKVVGTVKKMDNPKLKIKTPKPLAKFKGYIKKADKVI